MRQDGGVMPLPALPLTSLPVLPAGNAWPLGVSWQPQGLNVAVWAPDATRLQLCIFNTNGERECLQLDLPACTDGVWHGLLPPDLLDALPHTERAVLPPDLSIAPGLVYGLRAHGDWDPARGHRFNPDKLLLDPWAQAVVGSYGRDVGSQPAGQGHQSGSHGDDQADLLYRLSLYQGHDPLDATQPDLRDSGPVALKARVLAADALPPLPRPAAPRVAADQRVICEIHVKGATMRHPAVPPELRGSYAGFAHPALLAHWRRLGITTLSLLPIHLRADEERLQRLGLSNYWGYSSLAWLAPETRYWSGRPGTTPEGECRAMIDALHAAGFEVVLDVVYNHSAETDELGPTLSLRGLANARYYRLDPDDQSRYVNWAGCGNVLDFGEPRVIELVLGSLRHWVQHYGVDGFRFDLAPILGRDRQGEFTRLAPFFAALQADPVLSRVLLIAEPWDIGPGGYQLGGFPPGWLEWNDQFRDTLRAWWLRDGSDRGQFVHRFAASSAQFDHDRRAPMASVNFITAHDGFTLRDLVSFEHKHNEANGEHNRDGHQHNGSCNCGVEGPSTDPQVQQRRLQLSRALLGTLLLSQGTPMLLAGDELGHSQHGNNNAYCQDNALTWLDWSGAEAGDLSDCVAALTALRREWPMLRIARWLGSADVVWRDAEGLELHGAGWSQARTLIVDLHGADPQGEPPPRVLLLINPCTGAQLFEPPPAPDGCHWWPLWDSLQPGGRPVEPAQALMPHCLRPGHSLLLVTAAAQARCLSTLRSDS